MSICLMQWHVYNDVLHAATSQVPGSRSAVLGLHAFISAEASQDCPEPENAHCRADADAMHHLWG